MPDRFDEQTELLTQVQLGNRDALGHLLASCRPYVTVVVRGVMRTNTLAPKQDDSDLIQETLMQASLGAQNFRGHSLEEWFGWLRQIAVRTSIRVLKSRGQINRLHEAHARSCEVREELEPSDLAIRKETTARMALALGRLPLDMQQVLLARIVDQRDYADIAEQLGRSAGATRMLYLRALRQLRDVWTTDFSSSGGVAK